MNELHKKQVSTILGVYGLRWPATLKVVDHHVALERLSRTTFEVEIQTFEPGKLNFGVHPKVYLVLIIDVLSIADYIITQVILAF